MHHRLNICQTCERDGPVESDGRTRGEHLTAALETLLAGSELRHLMSLRRVPCLSGCPNPCNASFKAPGKLSLRFSLLGEGEARDLLGFARLYIASEDGEVDEDQWPESLRIRLTATVPAPPAGPAASGAGVPMSAPVTRPATRPGEDGPRLWVTPTPNFPPVRPGSIPWNGQKR